MGCLPSYVTYGWYVGSTWICSSTRSPSNLRNNCSSMFACMKAPGMSQVITLRSSFALIILDKNRDSTQMVGELVSSFDLYSRCFLPSAHPYPFTLPHRFSFKNMRYFRALYFSHRERVVVSRGCITL